MDPIGTVRRAVWASDERRLRMPVRLLLTGLGFVLVSVVLAGILRVVGIGGSDAGAYAAIVQVGLSGLVVAVAVLVPCGRFLDRRQLRDFGFRLDRDWSIDCGFGLALGAGLQTAVFGVGWLAGWYEVTATFVSDGSFAVGIASVLMLFLSVGVYEELVARGWLLTNLAEGLRFAGESVAVGVAVALSAGVFGAAHAVNPGATPLSTLIIALAGVFLALGYVLTGELAIPIGVHVTWNLFQGAVFGFGVSGLSLPATVLATEPTGPKLLTGGSFGPEAGLLGLAAIVVGSAAIAGWVQWRTGSVGIHPRVMTPELVTDVGPEEATSVDPGEETETVDSA